ncbi:hypothetical protein NDU88_002443 [Pleurodeles waltl]|uniref:Reverse transcriptase domain-containing protein n=1 Tax=Pleurodeles waltl TaxID=8319 RepID=A0AAV7PAW1_PLEWA|nr:hypothetical protein NDU88_002443 [Pleurodeles waltl]
MKEYLDGFRLPRLTDAQIEEMEGEVFPEELHEALGGMASGKTPGPDGIPVEICHAYSAGILPQLLGTLHESHRGGLLPKLMKETLIVMLRKPGRVIADPGSYRPLSMLNVDVKLLAKVLAMRIRQVVTHLVGRDQCGFIPGMGTHMNLRRLSHVMHETRELLVTQHWWL